MKNRKFPDDNCSTGENYDYHKVKEKKEEDNLFDRDIFTFFLHFFKNVFEFVWGFSRCLFYKLCVEENSDAMSRRRDKAIESLGPITLLKSVRDQLQIFQEKRGITADENNFVNLVAVIIQQSGQAMYAVFTMFLALLPVLTILIHVAHFVLDRIIDVITTRRKQDLWVKGAIFIGQLTLLFIALKFIIGAIFAPIFSMQITIISKMLFFEDDVSGC